MSKLTDKDTSLMRAMWDARVWEGYTVTPRLLAEWFYCHYSTVDAVLRNGTGVNHSDASGMRRLKKSGTSTKDIAKRFNCSASTVYHIVRMKG